MRLRSFSCQYVFVYRPVTAPASRQSDNIRREFSLDIDGIEGDDLHHEVAVPTLETNEALDDLISAPVHKPHTKWVISTKKLPQLSSVQLYWTCWEKLSSIWTQSIKIRVTCTPFHEFAGSPLSHFPFLSTPKNGSQSGVFFLIKRFNSLSPQFKYTIFRILICKRFRWSICFSELIWALSLCLVTFYLNLFWLTSEKSFWVSMTFSCVLYFVFSEIPPLPTWACSAGQTQQPLSTTSFLR